MLDRTALVPGWPGATGCYDAHARSTARTLLQILDGGRCFPTIEHSQDDVRVRMEQRPAEALVISLGVDTYENDPISFFKLASDDFTAYGRRIGEIGLHLETP